QLTKEQVTQQRDRLQVHGELSFTYGWQKGGGDLKGGSLFVSAYDPNTGIELGVGYAQYQGDGWYGYGPGYYYSARNPYSFAPGGGVRHP
ncbi:MAG TPA: hypothetical protein VFJ90_15535, partial [Candidatus Didemnitutus sp.]|nr:hypothetical protein [Candidatus Didemnitutus sp.]